MSELTVRTARGEEYEAIGELTHAAYTHDYDDLPDDYKDDLRHPERLLDEYDIWVAERGGVLVGAVAIRRDGVDDYGWTEPDELYFRLLAVSPDARGQGIGQALVEQAFVVARERGRARVSMNSGPDMVGAHALYRKLGFREPPERQRLVEIDGRTLRLYTFVRDVVVEEAGAGR